MGNLTLLYSLYYVITFMIGYWKLLTYMGLNVLTKPFLAYNRWFPVKVRVSFIVDIDLYWVILFGCFSRNVLTSLYVTIPVDDTTN